MERTDKNTVKRAVPLRPDDANKGTMGSLLSVCGCYGMAGAAILSGRAALRSGLGLLKSALPESIYPIVASAVPESVFYPLSQSGRALSADNLPALLEYAAGSRAVMIGCGLSVCADTRAIVRGMLASCRVPILLDADALNCIAGEPELLRGAAAPAVVTPHPAEMGRMIGKTAAEVNSARIQTAARFAEEYGAVTLLKGAGTFIASPDGRLVLNTTGNSGMATGGSGDVLSGIIGALLAQGAEPFDAAAAGAYLHGLAGDLAAERLGRTSMLPGDIIDELPGAFMRCGIK